MASELGPYQSAVKVVVFNPDSPTQVRQVSGSGSPQWVALTSAVFAECVTTAAQAGSTGIYFATLPTGLSAYRAYEVLIYSSAATAFSDSATLTQQSPLFGDSDYTDYIESVINDTIPALIAGQNITVQVAVDTSDDNRLHLYQGFNQGASSGVYLPSWTVTGWTGPSMSGGTLTLRLKNKAAYNGKNGFSSPDLEVSGTISQSGTTLTITAPVSAAQSATLGSSPPLDEDTHRYVLAGTTSGGIEVPILYGWVTVHRDIPPEP